VNQRKLHRPQIAIFALLACLVLAGRLAFDDVLPANESFDPGGCTTAVISGAATASGRPLLWKNRDVSQPDQEIVYSDDGSYSYVTIANAGDSSQAWGGVNSAGFAIEDANNWNTTSNVSGPDDDGKIIKLALRTCAMVSDFQLILDSTSVVGHTQPAIFGVIDTAGGASIFETFAHSYVRYDASNPDDAPRGILVRSNYSYAGSQNGRIGIYRHDRAKLLIEAAIDSARLDAHYMCQTVARDLRNTNSFNPYPLPYEGRRGSLPYGWVPTIDAICRRLTVSACVIEGVLSGENPLLFTLWAFPMAVQYGVALPFWVASATTPPEVNGSETAPLCNEGLRLKTIGQHASDFHDTLDTYILNDGRGGGLHVITLPLEDQIFAATDSALALWRVQNLPDSAGMTELSADFASLTYQRLSQWPQPGDLHLTPSAVNDVTVQFQNGAGLVLHWSPVATDTMGLPVIPVGYSIFHSDSLSFPPAFTDSLGFTADTLFVIPAPPDNFSGFFRVRAVV
jgi:hypothetical protein